MFLFFFLLNLLIFQRALAEQDFLTQSIGFWESLYSEVSTSELIIYDALYPVIVYERVDASNLSGVERSKLVIQKKQEWKKFLLCLHQREWGMGDLDSCSGVMSEQEKKLENQLLSQKSGWKEKDPLFLLKATHRRRLKARWGQKERFEKAFWAAKPWIPKIVKIFKKEKMNESLAFLPYVESYFDQKAISSVGASGIWQLMPSTARKWIQVSDQKDERNIPLKATVAALHLLQENQKILFNQIPLAITAYNHGRRSISRAIRVIGSINWNDLEKGYKIRSFGLDGRNFYPQFCAVTKVHEKLNKIFFY